MKLSKHGLEVALREPPSLDDIPTDEPLPTLTCDEIVAIELEKFKLSNPAAYQAFMAERTTPKC